MDLEEFKDLKNIPDDDDDEQIEQAPRPILEDLRTLRKYTVPNYPVFIGREKNSYITIPVPAISRKHAKVFERDKLFFIQDLGSINGTFVNDKRILDPIELKEGDRIKLGITQKYPSGARELVFKNNVAEQHRLEQVRKKERDSILKDAGITPSSSSKKIALRHCIFTIAKRDFVSVFKTEEGRRVPLVMLDLAKKMLAFQSMVPFRVKDTIIFSINHPRIPESLKLILRIVKVTPIEPQNYGVVEHKGLIIKFSDKHKTFLESLVDMSDLICYLTSTCKSWQSE